MIENLPSNKTSLPGRILVNLNTREVVERQHITRDQPRASSPINYNYCVNKLLGGLLAGSQTSTQEHLIDNSVNLNVVTPVHTAPRRSWVASLSFSNRLQSKICERCFLCHSIVLCKSCNKCHTCCNKSACPTSKLLANLAGSGCRSESSSNPERGLHPTRPNLTRSPTVISCYVNPHRNSYLLEALHQLMDKNAIELVHNQTSLGFFNRLFLVPKPNNKWRPILDLSKLNLFLRTEKFKMETPETIRTSLQQGEWVTSIDFKDA